MARVAELAGVSKATVSRVINRPQAVHPDTVRAVRRAIERARYAPQPGRVGRPVGSRPSGSQAELAAFGLVVPELSRGLYWSLQHGFAGKANELHHQILVCDTKNDVFRQADEILQLACKRVAGVAIVSATSGRTPPAHVEALQNAGIPAVILHREIEGVTAPLIWLPIQRIAYEAGRAAIERGHRRIAMITRDRAGTSSKLHEAGFQKALAESSIPFDESLIVQCELDEQTVSRRLGELWTLPPRKRPTAFYCTFDTIAELVYVCLARMGVRVPQDVSIISFGDSSREGAIASRLTSVVVDEAKAGRRAVELCLEMRRGTRDIRDTERFEMSISLADGQTLASPPRQRAAAAKPA